MFKRSAIYWLGIYLVVSFLFQSCSPKPITPNKDTALVTSSRKDKNRLLNNSDLDMRGQVVDYATRLKGAKYQYGGESPKGFDCSGFTSYVLSRFSVPISRTSSSQSKQGKKVSLSKAQAGDLVFFSRGSSVFHVAMVVSNENNQPKIIHSTSSRGVIVTDLKKSTYWLPKLHSIRNVISR